MSIYTCMGSFLNPSDKCQLDPELMLVGQRVTINGHFVGWAFYAVGVGSWSISRTGRVPHRQLYYRVMKLTFRQKINRSNGCNCIVHIQRKNRYKSWVDSPSLCCSVSNNHAPKEQVRTLTRSSGNQSHLNELIDSVNEINDSLVSSNKGKRFLWL